MIATAESCTGGLIAGALTDIAGSSDVVDRGFVTYSNEAKAEMIGVPMELINRVGAVSKEVALSMAEGALSHSRASVTVAVTGVAGPGGSSNENPSVSFTLHRHEKAARPFIANVVSVPKPELKFATRRLSPHWTSFWKTFGKFRAYTFIYGALSLSLSRQGDHGDAFRW